MALPRACFNACDRLITLPAPWQVEPKVWAMASSVPLQTKEAVPMSPGMRTGCPTVAVVGRHLGPAGSEGPGGPLAVHAGLHLGAANGVGLQLGDVVGHVVDEPQVQLLRGEVQRVKEGLLGEVHDHLPVGPGVVGRARHGRQVLPPLR